ncbi:MAG: sugar phosphate isomerase/epimerase [Rhizobiales bacterium]|nr:sugar phosphate isomerase/epimerase [Hyphomicrobiales bacterium]NRB14471.1 sugar phosphate isomerase/epimerase [Hyphomicrobiales bacterium]
MTDFSYQLYSSRNFPPLSETLKMLGQLGYKQVEGYGGLYADLTELEALKADLKANGLHMATGHFGFEMVRDESARVLEIAKELNMEGIFVPAIPAEERQKDAAGWRAFGKELAAAGAPYWAAGLTFGWHNHAFEFAVTETGEMPLDLILEADERLALEFDVAWGVIGKQDPIAWIEKYADRIVAAHVKDIAPAGECTDEDGWADVGQGTMDWSGIMVALKKTNAKYFVMEHDNPSDAARFAKRSIAAAKQL